MSVPERFSTFDVLQTVGELCYPNTDGTAATVQVYVDDVDANGKVTAAHGTTKPADNDNNYAVGCIFRHTDNVGITDAFYINAGSVTNCNFDAVATGSATSPNNVTPVDAAGVTPVYPLLVDGLTGDQVVTTDAGISYNATTNVLSVTGITSAAAAALTIVPLTGQAVLIDGAVSIDAGVVTGATSITSTTFIGALTGNASTATSAATLTTARDIGGVSFNGSASIVPQSIQVLDTADATAFVALFEEATGNLLPKTDAALTYNAGTGALTATSFVGALTGNAATVTVDATTSDASCFVLLGESASGSLEPQTDATLTYDATTGALTATSFVGALTGNAATVTVDATTADASCFVLLGESASGSLEPQTDATLTYDATTGALTATTFVGALSGNASTVTVDATTADTSCFVLLGESASGSLEPQTDATLTYDATTGALTATSFVGALTGDITGSGAGITANTIPPKSLPAVPTDMGAANIIVDISNSNGSFVTSIVTDGPITGASTLTYALLATADNVAYTAANQVLALSDGVSFRGKMPAVNSGDNCTLNVNGLGAKTLVKRSAIGDDIDSNDLLANTIYTFVYNSTGTVWQVQEV